MVNSISYRVSSRYMEGSHVLGYRLIGENGSKRNVSREDMISMAEAGLIENIRIQTCPDGSKIVRGKGININELPVRSIKDGNDIWQSTRYFITRRVFKGDICIGYEVEDRSGNRRRLSKKDIKSLVADGVIGNVKIGVAKDSNGKMYTALVGTGIKIHELPKIVVDDNNNVISNGHNVTLRAIKASYSGIVENLSNGAIKRFRKGEYIVIGYDGEVEIVTQDEFNRAYRRVNSNIAYCDSYLDNIDRYKIKVVETGDKLLSKRDILKWSTVRHIK